MVATCLSIENLTDAELVRLTLAGDRTAFDALVNRYQRRVVAAAYRLLGNTDDSLEVAQDAFSRAYRSLSSLKDIERFGSWLLRITTNRALNFRRARGTGPRMTSLESLSPSAAIDSGPLEPAASDDPERRLTAAELVIKARRAIDRLPTQQRLALTLSSIEEMPQRDVAAIMECSVEAVKWHVFQARKTLRAVLADCC